MAAHELCESYARRTTHDAFIKAYNMLEAKLIAAVGVGKIPSPLLIPDHEPGLESESGLAGLGIPIQPPHRTPDLPALGA